MIRETLNVMRKMTSIQQSESKVMQYYIEWNQIYVEKRFYTLTNSVLRNGKNSKTLKKINSWDCVFFIQKGAIGEKICSKRFNAHNV